jgi:hypothetical protein
VLERIGRIDWLAILLIPRAEKAMLDLDWAIRL